MTLKKFMKIPALMLAAVLIMSLAACGQSSGSTSTKAETTTESQIETVTSAATETTEEEQTEAVTDSETEEASEEPSAEGAQGSLDGNAEDTGDFGFNPNKLLPLPAEYDNCKVIDIDNDAALQNWMSSPESNVVLNLGDGTYTLSWAWINEVDHVAVNGTGKTKVVSRSGESTIIAFNNSSSLCLANLILGHDIPAWESCTSGVLYIGACQDVTILNCDLYGCGVIGIESYETDIEMVQSTIRDCSEGALSLYNVTLTGNKNAFTGNGYNRSEWSLTAPMFRGGTITMDTVLMRNNSNVAREENATVTLTGTVVEENNGWQ